MGNPEPGCYCESCNALRVNLRLAIERERIAAAKPHRSVYDRARYASLKARGKCTACGKAFAQRGLRCTVCAEVNHAASERARKAKQLKKNLDKRQEQAYIADSSDGS